MTGKKMSELQTFDSHTIEAIDSINGFLTNPTVSITLLSLNIFFNV